MAIFFLLLLSFIAPEQEIICTSSSSAGPRFAPKLAFDKDPSTRWAADFKERSGWIQVTFGRDRTFDSLTILGEGPELKGMPGRLHIQFLKDEKWRNAFSVENRKGPEATFRFDPVASRSWRVLIQSVVNPRWSPTIAELTFSSSQAAPENEEATTNLPSGDALKPRITASGRRSDRYSPANAVDGNMDTKWQAPADHSSGWICFEYSEPRTFNFLTFDVEDESGYGVPKVYRLEVKKGRKWKIVLDIKNGDRHYARKTFRKTKGKSWRLAVDETINRRYSLAISEIRLSLEENPETAASMKPPPAPAPTAAQIKRAIRRGREYLLETQDENGTWETHFSEKYPMGVAALGALALMKSGVEPDDPAIHKALEIVVTSEIKSVYGTALALMALDAARRDCRSSFAEEAVRFLVESQDGTGFWGYPEGRPDHSNTQYALLGLRAAVSRGVKVPDQVWFKTGRSLLRTQLKNGGWNYVPSGKRASEAATGSMTAAGIASLLLASSHSSKVDKKSVEAAVERGFQWLGDHFTTRLNPGSAEGLGHYYYLYGLERVGQFARRTRIGRHGWYSEGAAHLCRYQRFKGDWQGSMVDTCFALLFLTQSSRPLSGS